MAAEVEVAMKTLSDTLRDAQVTDGFSEVLDEKQLDEVHCAALRLSTAVTEYLAKAILYLESNKRGTACKRHTLMIFRNLKEYFYGLGFYYRENEDRHSRYCLCEVYGFFDCPNGSAVATS